MPHAGKTHGQQQGPGEHGGTQQVGKTVGGDYAIDDGNESPRRPPDLHPRAAQCGGNEAGNDGRPDAGAGGATRGNRESHRQRQGEHPDRDPRSNVLAHLGACIAGQTVQQLGVESDFHGRLMGVSKPLYEQGVNCKC